jgi:hypothetical protein
MAVELLAPVQLEEPSRFQVARVDVEGLTANERALYFARDLAIFRTTDQVVAPNFDYLREPQYFLKSFADGAITEVVVDQESSSMGLVLTEVDLKHRSGNGISDPRYSRLERDEDGQPRLLRMGPERIKLALAARASEYAEMHSGDMHDHVLKLLHGEIPHVPRSNTRSEVVEEALGMQVISHGDQNLVRRSATKVISTQELSYKRKFSGERELSRGEAAKGSLILGPDGVVSSIYALGGMPPVTGSVDSITTAAMSYMRSWIPRNGVFAGDFDRQLELFVEARNRIQLYGLPPEIEKNAIAQIGIAVGSDNPQKIAEQVKRFKEAGGHAVRIYTTNPDSRVVKTAMAINRAVGNDFLICVGPVVDINQARVLKDRANVRMFLAGHGGGENCTSLSGGGAANSLEILYEMYLDQRFNDSLIGVEGGTGTEIGGILPLLDVISWNKRGVGGIESTGGIYAVHDGVPVLPYHGSASVPTKSVEYAMLLDKDPDKARKMIGPDGMLLNVEGKPGYLELRDSANSNAVRYSEARQLVGRVMADMDALSIYELRNNVRDIGHDHAISSGSAIAIARPHNRLT